MTLRSSRLSALLLLALVGTPLSAAPRPNIIFILCDDLGFGATGPTFQNERAARGARTEPFFATPSLDRLAAEGVQLQRHYAAAPICVAARASLLLGLTQGHSPIRDNAFDEALPDRPTLASVLRRAGYATAVIGKWGLQGGGEDSTEESGTAAGASPNSPDGWVSYPTKRGFDFFFGYVRHKDGHFHYPKEDGREVWENDREVSADLDLCYTTDLFTARTKRWIVEHRERSSQPFFVYLAFDTPHAVMAYPSTEYPAGGGRHGGVQWTGRPGAMLNTSTGAKDTWCDPAVAAQTWDHDGDPTTPEQPWPDVQKRFATSLRRIDAAVGDLMQLLRDLGIDRETLVVFTSDNGPTPESYLRKNPCDPDFFDTAGPLGGLKRDTLEGGVRVPTFVSWPGVIPAGKLDSSVSGQWDWLATFAELAGFAAPAFSDGVSLVPRLTGRGAPLRSTAYFEYFNARKAPGYDALPAMYRDRPRRQMQTVHADRFVGVRYDVQSAQDDFEIFDLENDPKQENNLAAQLGREWQREFKARALQARRPEPSARRPYDDAPVPAAIVGPLKKGRLRGAVYEGRWEWVPDFRALQPVETRAVERIGAALLNAKAGGLAFSGYFYAADDGDYAFHVTSDRGAVLFLHEARLVDDVASRPGEERSGVIRLAAGWHPFRLYSRHVASEARLEVTWQKGEGTREPLAGEAIAMEDFEP